MRWKGERESDRGRGSARAWAGRAAGSRSAAAGSCLIVLFALLTGTDPTQLLDIASQVQVDDGRERPAPSPGRSARPPTRAAASPRSCSPRPRTRGARSSPRAARATSRRAWCCSRARSIRRAAWPESAVGPFYCPARLAGVPRPLVLRRARAALRRARRLRAAYVIAHEVGHHVQNLLGVSAQVSDAQRRASREEANELSVRLELQADCFAGVWGKLANRERDWLEPGDIDEGLAAAAAIGDDTLQRRVGRLGAARELDARLVGDARALAAPRARVGRHRRVRHVRSG